MKIDLKLLLFFILFHLSSCENLKKNDERVSIQNNANYDIRFLLSISYPDTNEFIPNSCHINNIGDNVIANVRRPISSPRNWEDLCSINSSGIIMMYIYNKDSFNYYWNQSGDCDSLLKRKDLVLKRLDLSMNYFQQNNWTIIYP